MVDGKVLPFCNIVDKGYRINLPAWRAGRQTVLKPVFARSDTTFTGIETIVSGSVASDCLGNERAVKRAKQSMIFKKGLYNTGCPKHLSNVWLTWSFQSNFMNTCFKKHKKSCFEGAQKNRTVQIPIKTRDD